MTFMFSRRAEGSFSAAWTWITRSAFSVIPTRTSCCMPSSTRYWGPLPLATSGGSSGFRSSLRDVSSLDLLRRVYELLSGHGVTIQNIDSVVICEKPKILPHVNAMKAAISRALGDLKPERIGIKGKTTEGLGFTGRREGIAAQAVALVRFD